MLLYNRFGTAIKAALAVAILAVLAGGLIPGTAYSEERPATFAFTIESKGELFPALSDFFGVSMQTIFHKLENGIMLVLYNDFNTIGGGDGGAGWSNECESVPGQIVICATDGGWIITCVYNETGGFTCDYYPPF